MPKVEIHVHLEGATSPELLFEMAVRNQVKLPVSTLEEWKTYYEFKDFNHFIEVYLLSVDCMRTPIDYRDMVIGFMSRQAEHHIRYSEVFFSTILHIQRISSDEILAALAEGIRLGSDRHGVEIAFIPDISWDMCTDKKLQWNVLEFALKARQMGIGIGLGIGGKEIDYPSSIYKDVFDEARRQDLHVVAHAGETGSPEIIRDNIDGLKPERIGHGVHSVEDPALVEWLSEHQIPLEVSPQSNYCTRVVPRDDFHPIRQMVDAGMCCTVNSDDPAMFSTDLSNEYHTLAAQGFSFDELWQLNMNGLEASFLDDRSKNELRNKFLDWYGKEN